MDRLDDNPDQPATVLIVDDDPGRGCCSARRSKWPASHCHGRDGATAIGAFQAQPSDCIVLDVVMPGMNGFDTCVALRELPNCRHVPILMQTSLDDMESVNKAYTAGATDFSSKGINPMLLAQRVKFLVRAKRTQDQLRASEARGAISLTTIRSPDCPTGNGCARSSTSRSSGRAAATAACRADARRRQFSRINDTHGSAAATRC